MFSSWSPFGRSQRFGPTQSPESVELRHGKNTYKILFDPGTLSTTTVADLKSLARNQANLAAGIEIKLLFQGKRLDDRETLGKYNVRDGSRMLMTSAKKVLEKPAQELGPNSPSNSASTIPEVTPTPTPSAGTPIRVSSLEKIAAIRQGIRQAYGRQINEFVRNPPATKKERAETKARLGELLLQQLLKFDNVVIDPDDFGSKEARLERKAAIKWVQGMMEEVDRVDVDGVE